MVSKELLTWPKFWSCMYFQVLISFKWFWALKFLLPLFLNVSCINSWILIVIDNYTFDFSMNLSAWYFLIQGSNVRKSNMDKGGNFRRTFLPVYDGQLLIHPFPWINAIWLVFPYRVMWHAFCSFQLSIPMHFPLANSLMK